MRREFGERGADASLILATTGVARIQRDRATDLPIPRCSGGCWHARWTGGREACPRRRRAWGRRCWRKAWFPWCWRRRSGWAPALAGWRGCGPGCAGRAAPWYLLCYLRTGAPFLQKFFWEHHFGRFSSEALQHRQPWWFYLPVLLAGLLPWTPLLALLPRAGLWADRRTRLLAVWAGWGLVFFSLSTNKLPGYVLPLVPAVAGCWRWRSTVHRGPLLWPAGWC
jgi:hypothetical protein